MPAGDEDRAHDQYHDVLPGWRGEGALEWPQPVGQNGGHGAHRCVRHICLPESMIEEISEDRRIVAAITSELITQDSTQADMVPGRPAPHACLCFGAWPVRPAIASRVEKGKVQLRLPSPGGLVLPILHSPRPVECLNL